MEKNTNNNNNKFYKGISISEFKYNKLNLYNLYDKKVFGKIIEEELKLNTGEYAYKIKSLLIVQIKKCPFHNYLDYNNLFIEFTIQIN